MNDTMLSRWAPVNGPVSRDEQVIAQWLRNYLWEVLAIPIEKVRLDASFQQMGLDSSAAVGMTGDLGEWLRSEIDAAAAYEHPTIRALARAVASPARGRRA